MKKYLIILFMVFISCNKNDKDYKKFVITDFSNKRIDTLKPLLDKSYFVKIIKVKGYVNDSIKIQRQKYFDINLSGKIDTLIRSDYYGGDNVIFLLNPYKATRGKLEIEYSL